MLLAAAAVALAPPRVAASRRAPPPRMASAVSAPPRELAPLSGADEFALGFDFGTSSARCVVIDGTGAVRCEPEPYPWGERERTQRAVDWADALDSLLRSIPADVRGRLQRIAVSGTSGSVLLVDDSGEAAAGRGDPRMYDFSVAKQAPGGSGAAALELLAAAAPAGHTARSATSALAKVLAWHCEAALGGGDRIAHQADYVASRLTGAPPATDWHNALKLGFDVAALGWPSWMLDGDIGAAVGGRLPRVVRPGEPVGPVGADAAARWGLPADCVVTGGTTDSIAAFLAAGAAAPGDAVSSLGSTLALKLLSATAADDSSRGVYSHRLGDLWLVGGASNAGCAVLREQGFSPDELAALSDAIDPAAAPPHADFYPLPAATVGERFPIADDAKAAVLAPVPPDRAQFLHCILHGIAKVEADGYAALADLGATPLTRVLTCGGGSQNPQWMAMREAMLGVPTTRPENDAAAYGAARLAAFGAG